ncbi:MAG: diaminopimelate epimerase [Planctomycetota bacterium]|jgi:diaminopimelate epimerase|nr:diaminopimelate epimerase [Planctomycetota bacterium]
MLVPFDKMEGAGNDFVLIDNRDGKVADGLKRRLVLDYCRRGFGIGADGMIFLEKDRELDFAWDFYNSDGSRAEMCGNGARCAARFAIRIGAAAGPKIAFRTLAGVIRAEFTPLGVKVGLADAALPEKAEDLETAAGKVELWSLNTGVPHAVVLADDLEAVDVRRLGGEIRRHPRFAPAGTNVNFISVRGGGRLGIRTYERGVEDETLACGTGCVASSLAAGRFLGLSSPVALETRGGGELTVHFALAEGKAANVFLEGGARRVFSGAVEI